MILSLIIKILLTVWLGVGLYLFIKSIEMVLSPKDVLNGVEDQLHDVLHHNLPLTFGILFVTCFCWPIVVPLGKWFGVRL